MGYKITTIGNCVQDIFIVAKNKIIRERTGKKTFRKYLSYAYGAKVNVDELHFDFGGEACNTSVGMRRLGIRNTIASVVGDDKYSQNLLNYLKRNKIGRELLVWEEEKNISTSFILLGPDRDRTILTHRMHHDFEKINLKKLFKISHSYYIAGINRYSKVLIKPILSDALKSGKKIYINPSAYQIEYNLSSLKKILKNSEIALMNVEEARGILQSRRGTRTKELLRRIKDLGPEIVVVTDGNKGAYVYDGENFYHAEVSKTKRVDSTGAGDGFSSTFVAMYIKGYNIVECMKFAILNSSSVISVYGAQRGLLSMRELVRLSKKKNIKVKKI